MSMNDIRKKAWTIREKAHALADQVAEFDRELAQPLYDVCDRLDLWGQETYRWDKAEDARMRRMAHFHRYPLHHPTMACGDDDCPNRQLPPEGVR